MIKVFKYLLRTLVNIASVFITPIVAILESPFSAISIFDKKFLKEVETTGTERQKQVAQVARNLLPLMYAIVIFILFYVFDLYEIIFSG